MGRPLLTAEQFAECERLRAEGKGLAVLAERYGITRDQIKMMFANARRKAKPCQGIQPMRSKHRAAVMELLRAGYSANKIRKMLRMDWRTAQAIAQEWQASAEGKAAKLAAKAVKIEAEMRAGVSAQCAGVVEAVLPTHPAPAPVLHDSYIESLKARGWPLHEARRQAELRRDRERNGPRRVHREMFV